MDIVRTLVTGGFTPWTVAGIAVQIAAVKWKPMLDTIQQIYGMTTTVRSTSKQQDIADKLEELDLEFQLRRIFELVGRIHPLRVEDGYAVSTVADSYEEQLADDVNEVLVKILADLTNLYNKQRRYARSWNPFARLDVDTELRNLQRRKMILKERFEVLCRVLDLTAR